MKHNKNYKSCKKSNILRIILLIAFIVIFSFILKIILAKNDTTFYGSYYGSVAGASITLIGVLVSLNHSDKMLMKQMYIEKRNDILNSLYLVKYKELNAIVTIGYRVSNQLSHLYPQILYLQEIISKKNINTNNLYKSIFKVLKESNDAISKGIYFNNVYLIQLKSISNKTCYKTKFYLFCGKYEDTINKLSSGQSDFVKKQITLKNSLKYLQQLTVGIPTIKENIIAINRLIPKLENEQKNKILNH